MGYCSKCHKELVRDGVKGRSQVASPPKKPEETTSEHYRMAAFPFHWNCCFFSVLRFLVHPLVVSCVDCV